MRLRFCRDCVPIGIFVLLAAVGLAAGMARAAPATALQLTSNEPDTDADFDPGLLVRELLRQAVLIAGRDDLGLPTRDAALREPFQKGDPIDIHTLAITCKSVRISLSRPAGEGRAAFSWSKELTMQPGRYAIAPDGQHYTAFDLATLTEEIEPLTRHELVDALKQAGFDATPPKRNAVGKVPEPIQLLLADVSFLSQFEAVRRTHAQIRASGESPALLGALARGYANLGQLTSYYWNATQKVFWARSLLYAQRMIEAAPDSAEALWARAYARALAGLHKPALDDLDVAAKRAEGKSLHPPHWVQLIGPFCRFETGKLAEIAANDKGAAPLAMYLCLITVERFTSRSAELEIGKAALQVDPDCLRIVDEMNRAAGVSYGHVLSEAGSEVLARVLALKLDKTVGLPAGVRNAMPNAGDAQAWLDPETGAKLARALVEAGPADEGEPSWGVLGRMIQEENFQNVYRRAKFLLEMLGVDASEYVRSVDPLVADHPYRNFIRSYGVKDQAAIRALLKDVKLVDEQITMADLSSRPGWINQPGKDGKRPFEHMLSHGDATAYDRREELVFMRHPYAVAALRAVSPYSPYAIVGAIEYDWKSVEPNADALEKESGSNPMVSAAFARRYIALGRWDDAERNLKRYLTKGTDDWAYKALADVYLKKGDEAQWLATLESALTQEDYGLSHANVQVQIARHFMEKNDYARAEPYAAAAAESWAAWAMECARDCYEGLGQWDKAEMWMQREVERYDTSPFEVYFWCRRTGHGDVKAARESVEALLKQGGAESMTGNAGAFYILEGRNKQALELMSSLFKRSGNPWQAMHAALLLDETGDAAGRDAMLKAAAESKYQAARMQNGRPNPGPDQARQLALDYQSLLASGLNDKTDPKELAKYLPPEKSEGGNWVDYFNGKFFALHGQKELAAKWFRHALENRNQYSIERALARAGLRSLEEKPAGGGQ